MTEAIVQGAILVLSVAALWLLGKPGPLHRWGYVVGLTGQPFYLLATWSAGQWGMFAASCAITALWIRGAVNHFK